jgi:hypothetical protein
MRTVSVVAFVPGAYMVATRYPGWKPVLGFLWLEVLPLTAYLYYSLGAKALLFPLLHWLFLGLYELGYLVNDHADTARERPERPAVRLEGWWLPAAIAFRLSGLAIALALCGEWIDGVAARDFIKASALIVALLLFHTFLGARQSPLAAFRVASFAGLAFGKYAPAALALATPDIVMPALAWIFLLYGAGRVLDYALDKWTSRSVRMLNINALWYLAMLFPAAALVECEIAAEGSFACLCVFGAYYLLLILKKSYRRIASNV